VAIAFVPRYAAQLALSMCVPRSSNSSSCVVHGPHILAKGTPSASCNNVISYICAVRTLWSMPLTTPLSTCST
jgi:hypothetical protein